MNHGEEVIYKGMRSGSRQDPIQEDPWSMQGYDYDDPKGLQDVTYARGEACIEKMKVCHVRNATVHILQKLEY